MTYGKPKNRLILLLLVASGLGLFACQKQPAKGANAATDKAAKANENIETADLNGDGKVDSWIYYGEENGKRQIMQRRLDLNFDGKVDITQYLKGGLVTLEELDLDFDG